MIKRDYLTEIKALKTQQTEVYSELWNELILFEEEYEKKGINFSVDLDHKSKDTLYLSVYDWDDDPSHLEHIIKEFCEKFNVDIIEKVIIENYIHDDVLWKWIFRSKNRLKVKGYKEILGKDFKRKY